MPHSLCFSGHQNLQIKRRRGESMTTQTTATWPGRSERCRFTALNTKAAEHHHHNNKSSISSPSWKHSHRHSTTTTDGRRDFSDLPPDLVVKIGASLSCRSLKTASLVCKSWCDALRLSREAMKYMNWGKQFKHGRGGFSQNVDNALVMFLKAADYGLTMAMVDAGLIYWERGHTEEAVSLYRKAAVLGDRNAQCNLGLSYLQVEPPNPKEAVKWLYLASCEGYVRAQYQLALCLHQGRGTERNVKEAAKWYLRAAEGGYGRAMYNVSLCYKYGEGLQQSHRRARKWMTWAAEHGHSKAQYEHGLVLFSEGHLSEALMYLELAHRSGERAAEHIKFVIIQQIPVNSCNEVMALVNNWRAPSSS